MSGQINVKSMFCLFGALILAAWHEGEFECVMNSIGSNA